MPAVELVAMIEPPPLAMRLHTSLVTTIAKRRSRPPHFSTATGGTLAEEGAAEDDETI
jgi:hypothetical protein